MGSPRRPSAPSRKTSRSAKPSFAPADGGGGDSRERLRVEHLLRMEYEVVPPEAIEAMHTAVEHGPRILKAEWAPRHPTLAAAAGAESAAFADWGWESPPLAESLQRIERKLDLLLERMGVDAPGLKAKPLYNVSLSASGLRFRDHRRECGDGDMIYLCLELPMDPTIEIMALAEVTCVVEDARKRHLSAGQDVVLEFRVIQDEARELIERYCRMRHDEKNRSAR